MDRGEIIIRVHKNNILLFERKYNNLITINGTINRVKRLTDKITGETPPPGETEANPPISLVLIGTEKNNNPYDKTIAGLVNPLFWAKINQTDVVFGQDSVNAWIEITKTFTNVHLGQRSSPPPPYLINEIGFYSQYRTLVNSHNEGTDICDLVLADSPAPILHAYLKLHYPDEALNYQEDINITITRRLYSPF